MSVGGQVPVMECVRASYAFLSARWREAVAPALLVAGAMGLVGLATGAGSGLTAILALVLYFAALLSYSAALLRCALGIDAAVRMRLGADEARLLLVAIAATAILLLVLFSAFLAFSLVLTVMLGFSGVDPSVAEQGGPEAVFQALGRSGEIIRVVGVFMVLAVVVFTALRLALAGAATIAEGRFMLLATWSWTKGAAWRMLAAFLLVTGPILALIILAQVQIAALFGGADALVPRTIAAMIVAFVGALLLTTLRQGLTAYLYRGLRPAVNGAGT